MTLYLTTWHDILRAESASLKEFLQTYVCSEKKEEEKELPASFAEFENGFALSRVPASLLCGFDAKDHGLCMGWRDREERNVSTHLVRVGLPRMRGMSDSALLTAAEHVEYVARSVRELADYLESWRNALNGGGRAACADALAGPRMSFMRREFEAQFVFFPELLRIVCAKCAGLLRAVLRQRKKERGAEADEDIDAQIEARAKDTMLGGIVCKTARQALAAKLLVLPGIKLRAQYGVQIRVFPPEEFDSDAEAAYSATVKVWQDSVAFYSSYLAEPVLRP